MFATVVRFVLFVAGTGLAAGAVCAQESALPAARPPTARAPFDAQTARAMQEAWARHLGIAGETTNSLGTKLALIPPGEFLMGSSDEQVAAALAAAEKLGADDNTRRRIRETERPQHRVTIARPFLMAATETTIAQFRRFVEESKHVTEAETFGNGNASGPRPAKAADRNGFDWRNPGYAQVEEDAVSQVTWNDAVAFCNWLSEREKLTPCYGRGDAGWELRPVADGYRLPTEAEWEYACRAGTETQYSFGDDAAELEKYGWFALKSGSRPERRVRSKSSNAFGLHDMHGNLFEWCQDRFAPYGQAAPGTNADRGGKPVHVMRGGDWFGHASRCRSAFRGRGDRDTRSDDVGFRVVRTVVAK